MTPAGPLRLAGRVPLPPVPPPVRRPAAELSSPPPAPGPSTAARRAVPAPAPLRSRAEDRAAERHLAVRGWRMLAAMAATGGASGWMLWISQAR